MNWKNRVGKWLVAGVVMSATAVSVGCLSRPVGTQSPTTKVNFTSTVSQQAVDKVDLLFAIDNSASMGDKQDILSEAVPNLLSGLLNPKCIDNNGNQVGTSTADPTGNKGNNFKCPTNSQPEFNPVTDMHIGIVSSSLGSFGGNVCPDAQARQNDHGRLLNLVTGGTATTLPDASPSNFLSWFPTNESNQDATRHPQPPTPAVTDFTKLKADFQSLVTGVQQNGCGLEAQLESVYHFLIAPDPWASITVTNSIASLGAADNVDTTVLQQRADFLRPDSLVAIIMLTDEDDSSADPQSVGGQGWAFMNTTFPGSTQTRSDGMQTTAPRATSICATNPLADGKDGKVACTSCGFAATCNGADPACVLIKNDPECQKTGGYYQSAEESLNTRFVRMKERFGIDPQYPISRYTDGLTKSTVPDRASEHTVSGNAIGGYIGTPKCTNPLFAKTLPSQQGQELCTLTRGTRTPDLVFFAVVGGVPNKLLHFDPNDADKSKVSGSDWNPILGKDPINFDYTGIDIHMVQSITPRTGVPGASTTRGDDGDLNADPVGRDWTTNGGDLQYACTFPLPKARNCTSADTSCDCADNTLNPPLCDAMLGVQTRAKAYPTIREFEVVRALGDQGIIASLCPLSLLVPPTDPTYGYNPAVISIINRLKNALTTQCLPQKLTRTVDVNQPDDQTVPCLVLATLGATTDTCDPAKGLTNVDPAILAKFREAQKAQSGNTGDGGTDLTALPVCQLAQLVEPGNGTCAADNAYGWCYVENVGTATPAGRCPQALIFSQATSGLSGATFSLQCIQQFSEEAGAGGP